MKTKALVYRARNENERGRRFAAGRITQVLLLLLSGALPAPAQVEFEYTTNGDGITLTK